MKRYLLPVFLLALAACKKDDTAPISVATSQSTLIIGNWDYKSVRILTTNTQNPRLNNDVTNTLTNRKAVFTATTATYINQGFSAPAVAYTLAGPVITFTSPGTTSETQQVAELTTNKMVLIHNQVGGLGINQVITDTYTK